MAYKQKDLPMHPVGKEIVKTLSVLAYSARPDDVFGDWLDFAGFRLYDIQRVLREAVLEGNKNARPAALKPEIMARWERMYGGYEKTASVFERALEILAGAAVAPDGKGYTYDDVLGAVYMSWGNPNPNMGQFFTPQGISDMMAAMTIGPAEDLHADIARRTEDAVEKMSGEERDMLAMRGMMMQVSGLANDTAGYINMRSRITQTLRQHFEPIKICDPCCGSGVMFLSAAKHLSTINPYYVADGLIRFYGFDIDPVCVKMAQINCVLYGIGGANNQSYLDMAEAQLNALPINLSPQQREIIDRARANKDNREAILQAEDDFRAIQMNMFDIMGVTADG